MADGDGWYEAVHGNGDLLQGDFLNRVPAFIPPDDYRLPAVNAEEDPRVEIDIRLEPYNVVVLTQSCDLEQAKVRLVLLGRRWDLEDFTRDNPDYVPDKMKEQLRRGNFPGYHLLNKVELPNLQRDFQVVDFKTVFSLPRIYVEALALEAGDRIRLLSPYREHLAQAFARSLMRVGLPADIPSFK